MSPSPPHPPLGSFLADYGEISTNQMGDVRPHLQGVEGIKFLCFPNLRPTEATEQYSLSAAQSMTVTPSVFLFVHSDTRTLLHHLFNAVLSVLTFSCVVSFSFSLARHYRMQR